MNPVNINLYAIADPERSRSPDLAEAVARAVAGGATLVQYRNKTGSTREMIADAERIRAALEPTGVPLLINDRVDVALAVGADGVHVGQSDMPASIARRLLGDTAIVGLTVKTDDDVETVDPATIDYACIGGVFQTASKDNPTSIGLAGWRNLASAVRCRAPGLPVGAIAGIDATNCQSVIEAGADGVAIISAIFSVDDVESATRELSDIISEAREGAGT